MKKFRIVPSTYVDDDYNLWHLEMKKSWFSSWRYIKMDRDKERLKKVAEFLKTPAEELE